MDQPTFADLEYASKKRKTRREIFLEPGPMGSAGRAYPPFLSQDDTLKQLGPSTCHSDRREESKSFAVVMRPAQLRDLSWLTRALDSSLRFATFGMTCARLGKVLLTEED